MAVSITAVTNNNSNFTLLYQEFLEKYYKDEINRVAGKVAAGEKNTALFINVLKDLIIFNESKLAEELFENPSAAIEAAKAALENIDNIHDVSLEKCQIRFINLPRTRLRRIRDLRASDLNKFISVEGIVRVITSVQFKTTVAAFVCRSCSKTVYIDVDLLSKKIKKPATCKCGSNDYARVTEKDEKVDIQFITIQDYFEDLRAGESPAKLECLATADLVGKILPGQRVRLNGVLQTDEKERKIFIINSIEKLESDYEEVDITEEDIQKIKELSADKDIYRKLTASIAPTIEGYNEIKLAIALQLFGSERRQLNDGKTVRGDIHVLLVGDPSTAKSDLISRIKDIAPRAIYAAGKAATKGGLTAIANRDERTGEWRLEAGALVLADKGIVVIDEFDKMSNEDRQSIHTALEQQYIDVAKAGLNERLLTRCTVLAAANPKFGRFDKYLPIAEQIDLDPAILSRFDLIFVITDDIDFEKDRRVAEKITENIYSDKDVELEIDRELLRKYIAYAKKTVKSFKITEEARNKVISFYLNLRARSKQEGALSVCARHLEAIYRLANASARVRLSDTVTVEDVERAIQLVEKSLEQIAVDPETGQIDIDYAYTGTSKSQRDKIVVIVRIIEELQFKTVKGAPEEMILERAEEQGIDREKAKEILEKLKERGKVYSPKKGHFRTVGGD